MITHQPYPSDVSDAEWHFVLPYVCLLPEDAGQRVHGLRDIFDGLRWLARSGAPWCYLPKDFPPWEMVYQQTRRWLAAGCFEAIVHDLRAVLRVADGRLPEPTAVILDSRTLQSTPESGARAGYDGAKRRKGSKMHMAVDTLGNLLALHVTPADAQDRAQVGVLAEAVQRVTGESVELAYVDQTPTSKRPAAASPWRSSGCPGRSGASCCCRGAGSWSGPSAGPPDSAAWRETTNACPARSPGCTTSPSAS
jgi:transposase